MGVVGRGRLVTGIGDEFTCDVCGGRFTKERSDEECWDEALDLYPADQIAREGVGTVCDDCYQQVIAWAMANAPELLREGPTE